jgi:transposase
MKLTDIARELPHEVWGVFETILPERVWCGDGRPPYSTRECLHGVLYVLVSGIAWRMLPKGFPSYRTCQRRLAEWVRQDVFRIAWERLALQYDLKRGINWDQICVDGAKHPAKKGAKPPAQVRWIVARPAAQSI